MATDWSFTLPPSHGLGGVISGPVQPTPRPDPSRAEIAAMAMQGYLSNPTGNGEIEDPHLMAKIVAMYAVIQADALIAALEKPKP